MAMNRRKIYPTWPEGKPKVFTMSYDDGNDCDIRLVELMRKHHVKGTFNINSGVCPLEPMPYDAPKKWRRLTMKECIDLYGDDMEIAVHGMVHPTWDRMPTPNAMQDILDDRRELERATGRIIRGAAFPNGTYNDDVVDILRLAGIAYCRNIINTQKLRAIPTDFLRLQPTTRNRDPKVVEITRKFVDEQEPSGRLWMLYIWGHSYEFVRDDSWHVIEEVLDIVGDRKDIWYATNIEMVDYMQAYQALQYNIDQTLVHNPTATDVWIRITWGAANAQIVQVPAGATLSLPE